MDGPGFTNEFVVVNGEAAGSRIVIPHGNVTIGSEEGSGLRFPVSGVSRRHAVLTSADGRAVLSDLGSRTGSWVNGDAITAATELTHGDLVQFGQVRLRFIDRNADGGDRNAGGGGSAASGGGEQNTNRPTSLPSQERLRTALLYAAGINIVGLFGNSLTSFLTEVTPTWTWYITPLVGLLVALAIELPSHYRKGQGAPDQPSGRQPDSRPDPQPQPMLAGPPMLAPHKTLAATLAVTLLLLGGGWLVTAGVSYAVGYFSGNEDGVQRLENQVGAQAQGVTVTILGVQSTPHFTRVVIRVNNRTSSSLSLPLSNNAVLTGPNGTTFDADSFRSSWRPQIPPGGQRKGTINFEGQLPEGATTVSLSFVRIYAMGFDGPRTITVPYIPLKGLVAWALAVPAPLTPAL